jgi:phosphoserine phosphatase
VSLPVLESRYGPEAQLDAQRRAQILLRKELSDAGCRSFAEVWRRVEAAGLDGLASQRTYRRIYNEGPALKPHTEGERAAEALAGLTSNADAIMAAFLSCWSLRGSGSSRGDHRLRSRWFAVVPRQEGRPFASVDLVEVRKQTAETISGGITRLLPAHEGRLRWDFRGVRRGDQRIFMTFLPVGPNNEISTGVIFLRRAAFREEQYEGGYVRLDEGTGEFLIRDYGWYQTVPQSALPRVALLDLDGTLRSGWVIREWLAFLVGEQFDGAAECLARVDPMLKKFDTGTLTHDALSNDSAQAYAALMKGKSRALVEELASLFVASDADTYSFSEQLVESLKDLSVAPIIVSGAPAEIASRYADRLGVDECHSLTLNVGADGRFAGSIARNPGLASIKRRIAGEFRSQFRTVVLAVGDSESDQPMLQIAGSRIIVGSLEPDPSWPAESLLCVGQDEPSDEDLLHWVRERIGPDDRFSLTPGMTEELMRELVAKRQAQRSGDSSA